jgi:chaperonin GroEL
MTEPALKHRKQLFQDSLNSTRSALKNGIVVGGGTALLRASRGLDQLGLEGDEALGSKLVMVACEAPVKQIARNSAHDPSIVLQEVLAASPLFGFNAKTDRVEDLRKAGVVDAVAGMVIYLECASSAAGVALLSEALVGDADEAETCTHEGHCSH